uniref:ATP synthase subunit b, chloroplastic n=1 Tax=Schizocladia ischiensis TaxID=196139 RepID=A0A7S6U9X6_9STRA|nr:AtpF [Schizocladia ischiensis]QOW07530.1 AtpF [Schizocladia ischiensis]
MENYLNFLILGDQNEAFTYNSDILESNVINVILLLLLLFFSLKNFLGENLGKRKNNIVKNVEDAEKRLNEANERLLEIRTQWSQIEIIIQEIKNQSYETIKIITNLAIDKANEDLSQRFQDALLILRYREEHMYNNLIKQVCEKALQRVILKLQTQLGELEQIVIVNNKIKRLGG